MSSAAEGVEQTDRANGGVEQYNLWKTGSFFLKKLYIQPSYDLTISILGVYPRRNENIATKTLHKNVNSSLIHNKAYPVT